MDSKRSKDQGTGVDCTNEAVEIATTFGMGYIDLTASEMDCKCLSLKVTVTNTDAVPYTVNLYPELEGLRIEDTLAAHTHTTVEVKGGGTATLDATNDHYKDRVIYFVTGNLKGQIAPIESYNGSTKVFTVSALTEAPADGDRFLII